MNDRERASSAHAMEQFLEAPTGDLEAWRSVWEGDHAPPIRSHRGVLGRLVVLCKRLLRPLVKAPQNDLWERQRAFNLALLSRLEDSPELDRLRWNAQEFKDLSIFMTRFFRSGIDEIVQHNDALYAAVDQKLDRYRRESKRLWADLGGALAAVEAGAGAHAASERVAAEAGRVDESELEQSAPSSGGTSRLDAYLGLLPAEGRIVELGCGFGEALELLQERGYEAHGVECSASMAADCRSRGLSVTHGPLVGTLADEAEASLAAVVSLQAIERLAPPEVAALVRLAWRALRPGGILLLETPNPLSLVVASSSFWRDPSHLRPVHPESLMALLGAAGFEQVRRLDRRPFTDDERLPEISLESLEGEARELADRVNRLRDRLDDLLFGYRDYAVVGRKP